MKTLYSVALHSSPGEIKAKMMCDKEYDPVKVEYILSDSISDAYEISKREYPDLEIFGLRVVGFHLDNPITDRIMSLDYPPLSYTEKDDVITVYLQEKTFKLNRDEIHV